MLTGLQNTFDLSTLTCLVYELLDTLLTTISKEHITKSPVLYNVVATTTSAKRRNSALSTSLELFNLPDSISILQHSKNNFFLSCSHLRPHYLSLFIGYFFPLPTALYFYCSFLKSVFAHIFCIILYHPSFKHLHLLTKGYAQKRSCIIVQLFYNSYTIIFIVETVLNIYFIWNTFPIIIFEVILKTFNTMNKDEGAYQLDHIYNHVIHRQKVTSTRSQKKITMSDSNL